MGKILVIDDDEGIRESLQDMLRLEHFECEVAKTAAEGFAIAEHMKPELIVTDIQLPDMSGYQICQRLKRNPASRNIPVVMMTARFTEPQDRVQGFELGADEFLVKPFSPVYFVSRIKSLLRAAGLGGIQPQTV